MSNQLDDLYGSANNKNLKTVMGVQMDMQRRNNLIVVGMLMFGQLVGKIPYVVIVNQSDRTNRFLVFRSTALFDQ